MQLDNQQSGEALNTGAGLFRFRSKTLATVASNNRLTSGDIVTANTTQNANSSPIQGMCTTRSISAAEGGSYIPSTTDHNTVHQLFSNGGYGTPDPQFHSTRSL